MPSEIEIINAMFRAKQDRDLNALKKTNGELKPLIIKSNQVLKGEVDINKLLPPSGQAK